MKKIKFTTEYKVYDHISELKADEKALMTRAIEVRKNAYAPYSNFKVGAAILLANGKLITGSNQENAAYPSGLCAERVAIFSAGSTYPKTKILKLAISASSSIKENTYPVAPCGACRQVIAEYEVGQKTSIEIFFMGKTGAIIKVNSLKDLLPLGFDKSFL